MTTLDKNKIPVTLLAGFLGSGKTTLLNYILSENHGKRIAVIENEFGEISIDHHLVIGAEDDIFEMNNGCVCCSIRSDLIETLNRLITRHEKFDAILIECTGLASPGPIAQAFLVEEAVSTSLKLDGIVTLVDVKNIEKQLDEVEVAWEQIAFSNVVLLNKTDLASQEKTDQLQTRLVNINPSAKFLKTVRAHTDLDQLLNIGGFDFEASDVQKKDWDRPTFPTGVKEDISSVGIRLPGDIDWNRFTLWLQMLLITEGMDVFRAKGILSLKDSPHRFIFQSVFMMLDGRDDRLWEEEPRQNQMVFIGRNLNRERLEAGVHSCLEED